MPPSAAAVQLPQDVEAPASYARWLAPQAGIGAAETTGIEQKLSALSRRTAAEMRRAEKERGEHARRLEALEELCRQHLGSLDARLGQAREDAFAEVERATQRVRQRVDQDLTKLAEAYEHQADELRGHREQSAESLRGLARRVEANHQGLEEIRAWRTDAAEKIEEANHAIMSRTHNKDRIAGHAVDGLSEQLEEQIEATLARDRKQAHERLRSSCAELTAYLNDLRRELVEQRRVAELSAKDMDARLERLQRELGARHSDVETQIAELGGALASRLQAKMVAMTKIVNERIEGVGEDFKQHLDALGERATVLESSSEWLGGQVQLWRRENAELHSGLTNLQDPNARGDGGQILAMAREEARTVHLEVMSLDTRVAAIEERLADDPDRRRYESLLRVSERS